jgi:GDP-4-dehydro-6-deoxy-D-mannose reductase
MTHPGKVERGRTVLITGASGFLGRHFVDHLEGLGYTVHGVSRRTGLDVTDPAAVRQTLESVRPHFIYHLAGPSFVPQSKADPRGALDVHVGGTLNVLEAIRALGEPFPRILLSATADGYRPDPGRLPFDEDAPQSPENPYAAAKIAQEALGRAWHATWGLPVVVVRLFNLIGPGQDPRFVASSFGKQAAEIALGRAAPRIEVGDLNVARDFVDWRDGIEGIRLALEKGRPGEVYNVSSGRPRRLGELLAACLTETGIEPEIVSPEHLARPGQAMVRCGNPARLMRETGWAGAVRPLEDSVREIIEYWKGQLSGSL